MKTNKIIRFILGFNTESVFTLNDSKKKSPGSVELRSKVNHSPEPSVDLALKVSNKALST